MHDQKYDAMQRAVWELKDEPELQLKHAFQVTEAAIRQYQRGMGISDPRALEMFTHPDVIEAAEHLAKRFMDLLDGDDGMMDSVTDLAVDFNRVDPTTPPSRVEEEGLIETENLIGQVIMAVARPLIMRVMDTGTWEEE